MKGIVAPQYYSFILQALLLIIAQSFVFAKCSKLWGKNVISKGLHA